MKTVFKKNTYGSYPIELSGEHGGELHEAEWFGAIATQQRALFNQFVQDGTFYSYQNCLDEMRLPESQASRGWNPKSPCTLLAWHILRAVRKKMSHNAILKPFVRKTMLFCSIGSKVDWFYAVDAFIQVGKLSVVPFDATISTVERKIEKLGRQLRVTGRSSFTDTDRHLIFSRRESIVHGKISPEFLEEQSNCIAEIILGDVTANHSPNYVYERWGIRRTD